MHPRDNDSKDKRFWREKSDRDHRGRPAAQCWRENTARNQIWKSIQPSDWLVFFCFFFSKLPIFYITFQFAFSLSKRNTRIKEVPQVTKIYYWFYSFMKNKRMKNHSQKFLWINHNFAGRDKKSEKLRHANRCEIRHLLIFHGKKFVLLTSHLFSDQISKSHLNFR